MSITRTLILVAAGALLVSASPVTAAEGPVAHWKLAED